MHHKHVFNLKAIPFGQIKDSTDTSIARIRIKDERNRKIGIAERRRVDQSLPKCLERVLLSVTPMGFLGLRCQGVERFGNGGKFCDKAVVI
ncbi:unnamed protein product [Lampetra fluviatilis]